MKIVIASDSFKGSLSSIEVGKAATIGIHDVIPAAEVVIIPMADGGEGTAECLSRIYHATPQACLTHDPLGRPMTATYYINDDEAIIETAMASGLTLLSDEERDPDRASSHGTGELIMDALRHGCRRITIGLGGSATNDAGVGMLRALGYRFLDHNGEPIATHATDLIRLARIDETHATPLLHNVTVRAVCDVVNPLYGPEGASLVFGPQKGATPELVRKLDKALQHFAEIVSHHIGIDHSGHPGSGAAGGIGFALMAMLNARMTRGAEMVLDATRFDEVISDADLVITGEGRLDAQTLMGKAPAIVLERAKARNVPVIAICGSVDKSAEPELLKAGFQAICPVSDPSLPLSTNMQPDVAKANIERTLKIFL